MTGLAWAAASQLPAKTAVGLMTTLPQRPAPTAPSRPAPTVPQRMGPSPTPIGNIPIGGQLPPPLIPLYAILPFLRFNLCHFSARKSKTYFQATSPWKGA